MWFKAIIIIQTFLFIFQVTCFSLGTVPTSTKRANVSRRMHLNGLGDDNEDDNQKSGGMLFNKLKELKFSNKYIFS